jgi:uncharacterized protein (TIGR02996 family)
VTFVVAYDVPTSYSDAKLQIRRVDTDDGVARLFAGAERAWFGEVFFDGSHVGEPKPAVCEPGYALVTDHAERGRPEQRPRNAHVTVHEYADPAPLLEEARRRWDSVLRPSSVIGIRVLRRQPAADPAWSPEARLLHAETLAHPDDDDPRLVFADAIAGKRGSLVIVQCDLARSGMTTYESRARRRAQRELLAKHGVAWSRLGGLAKRCVFRRGFVESAEVTGDVLINDHARVFDAAPHLTSIAIDAQRSPYTHKLAELGVRDGWWQRLRGLSIDSASLVSYVDGMLAGLRALEVSKVTPQHAHALVASGNLRDLEILGLPSHELGNDALGALVAKSPKLRVLDVASARSNGMLAIPESVRELYTTQRVEALPRALEKLALYGPIETRMLEGLTALRSLDLSAAFAHQPIEELALPQLRELRPFARRPEEIVAMAGAFGSQLELLDVRGIPGVEGVADELRELVAGDVWLGKADLRRPLKPASYLPDEPMWDVGSVELSG